VVAAWPRCFWRGRWGAEGFSRPVAIKRVLDGLSRDPQFSDMFIAEAQLCARLQHPNLVSVFDFDRDSDGGLFLVMELVDGVDLHRHVPELVQADAEVALGLGRALVGLRQLAR
jgi:serine/threonine-protein kinase